MRACIMQERACVCVHGFFCTQMDVRVCMSTANSHKYLFFHRLALYVWRASCLLVHLCVFVCFWAPGVINETEVGDPFPPCGADCMCV